MKRNPVRKQRKLKLRMEIELDGDAALAFWSAFDLSQEHMKLCYGHKARFAEWLVERAAEAYAAAPESFRASYWCFDLRPRDRDELSASKLLDGLNTVTPMR